ncbi:hypothetical protein TELCIR_19030, partial [Teladorsagia circumcincta]
MNDPGELKCTRRFKMTIPGWELLYCDESHLASLPQKEAELSKVTAENEERCRMLEEHAEGLTRKTDVLLESLCTDLMMNDLAAVESEKSNLEEKVSAMEKTYESVTSCASSFIEDLSAEEMNVHGKRVVRDYMAGIIHVREQLSAARERRKRCLELVDVRRLKLQQFTQLFTCENDAQQ